MKLAQLARVTFSGHESFSLRFGWLPKVAQWLPGQPDLFNTEDAPTLLGVGKNMVASMRYWSEALGLITAGQQKGEAELTALAKRLVTPEGWDPYLEDPGTPWLLHWQLIHHPERATLAYLLFTQFPTDRFEKEQVLEWLDRGLRTVPHIRATSRSLDRDFDVLMRTYLPAQSARGLYGEDAFDSPLIQLGLLRRRSRQSFEFVRGDQPSLPLAILAYAVMQFWQRTAPAQNTLALERLMYDAGSPGAAFKLTESVFIEKVLQVASSLGLSYDDTAGVRVISRPHSWTQEETLAQLESYYNEHSPAAPTAQVIA